MVAVKQANPDNLAKIDGLQIYAGNDDMLAEVLDLGEPGGILTGSHVFGEEMRRMIDEPRLRRGSRRGSPTSTVIGDRAGGMFTEGRAEHGRVGVGYPRLPYVELDERGVRGRSSALLERHGLLQATSA